MFLTASEAQLAVKKKGGYVELDHTENPHFTICNTS